MNEALPLLFCADGYRFPDVYHTTRFLSPDPIIALEEVEELIIVTSSLEEGRAKKESRATSVINWDRYGAQELAAQGVQGPELTATVIKRFLDERELARVALPAYFSVGIADRLREMGVELVVLNDLGERRRAKRPDELEAIEATQRATEEAWQLGVDALRRASVRKDRVLELDGAPFTAERLRAIVEVALLERGCASDGAICAPGAQAADPHKIGEGPLHAGEPIVMDIFPQHKATRYWADMTRTVSKGEPPKEIRRMYDVVRRAQDAGIEALRPGIIGRAVHELVEDIIWEAGYDTLRPGQKKDPANPTPHGFIHSTGHGVGLEIHEAPGIGRGGTKPLIVGDVVTIEPGVYDPAIGGVRLEDMLVITEHGARNLTKAPRQLVV
ncbi:MAG: aminopeptidase P family protein [Chloroflexi bacterium]|nr:MAG: aminopeptidase P family protein [Chloroflexota bacterium]TMG36507.1 MAG: aminopeptidase P family protein [Chloroflexota bacterium]